jgi:5-methylcytosine-specific restriction endonuclease McrA
METRARVLDARGHQCARCHARGLPLEVHHRDHDHTNNGPGNLEPLCRSCHAKAAIPGI